MDTLEFSELVKEMLKHSMTDGLNFDVARIERDCSADDHIKLNVVTKGGEKFNMQIRRTR